MEPQKIGKFIYELRKEKALTQKQLADKVGVSDKTISKWETGRGIPDTAIMGKLCNELGISINELLSGEKLSGDSYNGKAEENMVNLLKKTEEQKDRHSWSKVTLILNLCWILLIGLIVCMLGMGNSNVSWFIDMPSLLLTVGFLILGLGISNQMKYFWLGLKTACVKEENRCKDTDMLKRADYALGFGIKIVLISSGISFFVGIINIMGKIDNPSSLGPNLAVAILTILYGMLLCLVLLIMKGRVHLYLNQ